MSATTGGHFAWACMQLLYKHNMIVGVKIGRKIQILYFSMFCALFIVISFKIKVGFAKKKCMEMQFMDGVLILRPGIEHIFWLALASRSQLMGKYVGHARKLSPTTVKREQHFPCKYVFTCKYVFIYFKLITATQEK